MSEQRKADLLVRVRYQNPLPPPPFPARLLNIPTKPQRYCSYEFLNPIISERELPMVLDGELGMSIELGKIKEGEFGNGNYWNGDRSSVCGTQKAEIEEEDAFLFDSNVVSNTTNLGNIVIPPGGLVSIGSERKKLDVSWLRRTEYLSSEHSKQGSSSLAQPAIIPLAQQSKETRSMAISSTFTSTTAPLPDLRHPTKSHLRAERSWDLLPDVGLWCNDLNLIRFGEDPGEGKDKVESIGADPRLPRAIFRPVEIPNEPIRISYYLPTNAVTAENYQSRRLALSQNVALPEDEDAPQFDFKYIRDYEVATTRKLEGEFVFCFDNGDEEDTMEEDGKPKRERGVYYTEVKNANTLRKRRPKKNEDPREFPRAVIESGTEFWHGISVSVGGLELLDGAELESRDKYWKKVTVPPVETAVAL